MLNRGLEAGAEQVHRPAYYRCFGLSLESEVRVVELDVIDPAPPDLVLRRGPVDGPMPQLPDWRLQEFTPDEDYFAIQTVGRYRLTDKMILFDQAPELPDDLVGIPLLGPVMAALLHRRGNLILHGSALLVDGSAVIFLGDKGAGKSTTAAAMIAAGHRLISDDVIAMTFDRRGAPMVTPAYPVIKISQQALDTFGTEQLEPLQAPDRQAVKHNARVKAGIPDEPVPVRAIYELQRARSGDSAEISAVDAGDALKLLLGHSYMARYGKNAFHASDAMSEHFRKCASLVQHVPIARLRAPDVMARLLEVPQLVRDDRSLRTA